MNRVCYILSYYVPDYVRTRTLVKALRNIDNLRLYVAINSSKGILRYLQTLSKLIAIRVLYDPEFYVLGFRGYELYWVIRLITVGRKLIYDHMMSPYDSFVNERKQIRENGLIAKVVYQYEKRILHNADIVLTDTNLHKVFFQGLFGVPSSKILTIPVGADEDIYRPAVPMPFRGDDGTFEVLFYGSFLPLHGMDIILKSALRLLDYPVHFTIIGGHGENLSKFHRMMGQLNPHNVTHVNWVEFESLPKLINRSDIGLGGPFGNTKQAQRVITGKTFQFLAMAKPVIVGKIDDDCGFVDKVNCLLIPQGDEKALAEAILWAFNHKAEIGQIGRGGYELYQSRYSIKRISEKLEGVFTREVLSS